MNELIGFVAWIAAMVTLCTLFMVIDYSREWYREGKNDTGKD